LHNQYNIIMVIIDSVELVTKYFSSLDERQTDAFRRLETLYEDWNTKINVISRADTGNLYCRHVLHSLAIAKFLGELAVLAVSRTLTVYQHRKVGCGGAEMRYHIFALPFCWHGDG